MKLVFNTKDVQELVTHTLAASKHRNQGKGLLLAADDGVYLMSTGLPALRDSKNDVKVVFARGHSEDGNARHGWTHLIEGSWLKTIMGLTVEKFTIKRSGNMLKLVGAELPDDPEPKKIGLLENMSCEVCGGDFGDHDATLKPGDPCPNGKCPSHRHRIGLASEPVSPSSKRKPKAEKAPRTPREKKAKPPKKSVPAGWIKLIEIIGDLGLDGRTARIRLRGSGLTKHSEYGWSWPPEDLDDVKEHLKGKKVKKELSKPTKMRAEKTKADLKKKPKKKVVKKRPVRMNAVALEKMQKTAKKKKGARK